MKHVNKFNEFINDTVNLNQSRIDTLTSRVEAIDNFLKSDDVFGGLYESTKSQGSYAHKTIIKPSEKKPEFDADVVFFLDENSDWEPKDYIEELYKRFKDNGTYKDKCGRGTRCVTIDYAGEFHLDIVPCIYRVGFIFADTYHICNKNENVEEKTDPQGYTDWLADKNSDVGSNNLVKVIRLLKYLRDIKQTFSCKSILLTTLVANQVGGLDGILSPYKDLPTSLKVLVNRLNDFLQDNENMPIVSNPVNDDEDFNRHWNQAKYENFRTQIERYNDWINDAFDEENQEESIKKWQKIFGDDFGKQAVAKAVSESVERREVIPFPKHADSVPWKVMPSVVNPQIKVTVHEVSDSASPLIAKIGKTLGFSVGKKLKVRMEYLGELSHGYSLYWQIINSGEEALVAGDLRGQVKSGDKVRWEDTKYKGVHSIECFIVHNQKKICTGRSGRHFVVVE